MTTKEYLEASKDAEASKDEEIYLERARFLLNIDDILEQILEDNDNFMSTPIYQENNIMIEANIPLILV